MMARILALLLLAIMIGCALLSWTMFTGWGLLASYVGSHSGGMAPQSELDAAKAAALRMFALMLLLQVVMFASSGFFVHSLVKQVSSRFRPSLKDWILGSAFAVGLDGVVIAVMLLQQTRS